uniref:AlNc14C10G1235 protein n=1 Tax=Albugo laibachii Nc14 TaxID=890382 RepID=F0W2I8_9STRA|nr:AlNc14C10G1235 [Albugo laibachii Nc14]|eukprot:CCA15274.1 AlNc14C10G1235 [Albugo laibachii Nc14]
MNYPASPFVLALRTASVCDKDELCRDAPRRGRGICPRAGTETLTLLWSRAILPSSTVKDLRAH